MRLYDGDDEGWMPWWANAERAVSARAERRLDEARRAFADFMTVGAAAALARGEGMVSMEYNHHLTEACAACLSMRRACMRVEKGRGGWR